MDRDHASSAGYIVIAAAAAAAVAYWIFSADEAKALPFAIAQYVLLASVTIGGLGGLVPSRASR